MSVELLDVIIGLPVATAAGVGDVMLVVQGGVLKQMAPQMTLAGTVGSSVVTINLASNSITGSFMLNVHPASGCTIQIEYSRNGGSSYTTEGSFSSDISVNYAKGPSDTSYPTHIKLTRTAGSLTTTAYEITNGYVAYNAAMTDQRGYMDTKVLVVDGTTRIKSVDPINDRGYISSSQGIDINIMQIENYAKSGYSWDYTRGRPYFGVSRDSIGACFVNAVSSTDRGTVTSDSTMIALSSAVANDYCLRSDVSGGTYYVLTAAPYSTLGNWVALPVGAQPYVSIDNPSGLELVQDGPDLVWESKAINQWKVS